MRFQVGFHLRNELRIFRSSTVTIFFLAFQSLCFYIGLFTSENWFYSVTDSQE